MAGKLIDFSFDGELNWKEVETYRQRLEFLPFFTSKTSAKAGQPSRTQRLFLTYWNS